MLDHHHTQLGKSKNSVPVGRNKVIEGAQSMMIEQRSSLSPRIQINDKGRNANISNARSLRQSQLASLRSSRGRNSDLAMPESLDETLTSAQFILKSLMLAFEMTQNQAAGLLSDNHRFLYHLCIKGLKGGSYN